MIGTNEQKRLEAAQRPDLATRIADAKHVVGKIWHLAKPYFLQSEERWLALSLVGIVLAMNFFLVWMSKNLNAWNNRFYTALQEKDAPTFWKAMFSFESFESFFFSFTGLALVYIVVAVYRQWLRQFLALRWRRWLTEVYYRDWLSDRAYYLMELNGSGTDNPEQRIEQDISDFTTQTLFYVFGLVSEIATLVTFTIVLWNLSGSIELLGITVPGYMLWAALIYAVFGTWATIVVGRPLVLVNFLAERFNADFRYRMVRVRENAESIALYNGEEAERSRLGEAFQRIYGNYWNYMRFMKRLTWLTSFYGQVAIIFPIVVQAPRYFAGSIPFGALTQTAGAFGYVQGSLSWLVDNFDGLASLRATVDRLTGFGDTIAATRRRQLDQPHVRVEPHASDHLAAAVDVYLPNGEPLLDQVRLDLPAGSRVVLQGPSGSGKTTLFRVLAGLWPHGDGVVRTPTGKRVLFIPQKPYMPIGTLREALLYPQPADSATDEAIRTALRRCNILHLADRLDETNNWSLTLSPGEQQRVAFARALLLRPDWLFLDEATSALDHRTEEILYTTVINELPNAAIVSIAHRDAVVGFHRQRLVIDKDSRTVRMEPLAVDQGVK